MKIFVSGAAGFIGSNLVDSLLDSGHEVIGFDNFSTGREQFLRAAKTNSNFKLIEGDLLNSSAVEAAMDGKVDYVFHLAANADVRFGLDHPRKDIEQNVIATQNLLEAMRAHGVKSISFSSTGSIYGEPEVFPTPEDVAFPRQTSLYGASKLAAEGLISAYCEGYGFAAKIFRFVSILGERYTHGHVYDFVSQLRREPSQLHVLGDGHQKKSYLYIGDCVRALTMFLDRPCDQGIEIYNLGTDEFVEVNDSIDEICSELNLNPSLSYAGGERGWVGDSPFILLDCRKIRSEGWSPKLNIKEAVRKTVKYLDENNWVFEERT